MASCSVSSFGSLAFLQDPATRKRNRITAIAWKRFFIFTFLDHGWVTGHAQAQASIHPCEQDEVVAPGRATKLRDFGKNAT
jgi:hypothetical protein